MLHLALLCYESLLLTSQSLHTTFLNDEAVTSHSYPETRWAISSQFPAHSCCQLLTMEISVMLNVCLHENAISNCAISLCCRCRSKGNQSDVHLTEVSKALTAAGHVIKPPLPTLGNGPMPPPPGKLEPTVCASVFVISSCVSQPLYYIYATTASRQPVCLPTFHQPTPCPPTSHPKTLKPLPTRIPPT